MPSFLEMTELRALLEATAEGDPRALAMLNSSNSSNSFIIKIEKTCECVEINTKLELAQSIAEGMAEFLRSYPAPASYKQKLWDSCDQWYRRIAGRLGVPEIDAFEEELPRPVERDLGVELVKALHDQRGKTKEKLAEEFGVDEKTIQTELRALDPALQKRGKRVRPLRLAGQVLHPQIQVKIQTDPNNPRKNRRLYYTEDRLHPIALQLNTQEAATLLLALYRRYEDEGSILSLEMALDVWGQISKPGQERIKEVYGKEKGFQSFIEDIEAELEEGRLITFHTEEEQRELLFGHELYTNYFKRKVICRVKIHRGGTRLEIPKARIIPGDDHDRWTAVPADEFPDETNAISFTEQDPVDIR